MQKYGTNPELDKLVDSDNYEDRIFAAKQDYGLDILITDTNWEVREAVAGQGYRLNILIDDKDWHVRDACINNDTWWSEFLTNNWEILVNHEDSKIRIYVAKQGYGLNILINDEDWHVCEACTESDAWPEFVDNNWEKLVNHEFDIVRAAVAKQGYGLDILINDTGSWVRAAVAKQGYGLDILINDKDIDVRAAVAAQGYGLDIFINDKSEWVRRAVATQGYGLDKLINDESYNVRVAVAKQGYGLDKLVNDENKYVREAVANQGYGLDVLINSKGIWVRNKVEDYLCEHHYKSIAEWAKANPDKVHDKINIQLLADLKDFIYKIDKSSKLEIQSEYDNIDDFFTNNESDTIVICTVDTKTPIITIEKNISNKTTTFKFIVDITNEDGDSFSIKTTIKSKEQLDSKLSETIESLKLHKEFSKYIDDLESCL